MNIMRSLISWESPSPNIQGPLRIRALGFISTTAVVAMLLLSIVGVSYAGSATFKQAPASGEWFTANNWVQGTIPNAPGDTATFASSNRRSIDIAFSVEVNGIVFNPGASPFSIATNPAAVPVITISGAGITNNSGIVQNFVVNPGAAQILFLNSATAGSLTSYTSTGTMTFGGSSTAESATFTNNALLTFTNTATAGDATVINNSVLIFEGSATAGSATFNNGTLNTSGGFIQFGEVTSDAPTAGNGTFTNPGSPSSTVGGGLVVIHFGTAGNATFINDGATAADGFAGETLFQDTGDAANAILIANAGSNGGDGGTIRFATASTGGTAQVQVFGNGNLDISGRNAPGVTTGSIKGNGAVFLGANKLTVGTNNLSTVFSGVIQDGGVSGGSGGSLTKVGTGQLSLTTANTYTGSTTIQAGSLLVKNRTGSATGNGAVQVNAGALGGTGTINGVVTVGTGSTSGAILLPGNSPKKPGTLTVNNTLTFNSLSAYQCVLNRTRAKVSTASALGVTINNNALFTFVDSGAGTLATGTVFTVVNNTSANPIIGTFSNLPDGSVFTSNGNNFQVNYTGGTGNDLTLTVVP